MDSLQLIALDADDLAIMSAHLQDAIVRGDDLAWRPRQRRFALAVRRFDWQAPTDQPRRRLSGLHFERVTAVRKRGADPRKDGGILNLLAITFEEAEAPAGAVTLVFSGGFAIRLEVECIEAQLKDLGPQWEAASRPVHPNGDRDT
jgi:hypothetical protein